MRVGTPGAGLGAAHRRGQAGFTLIEILVVILILGILATVVLITAGRATSRGRTSACRIDNRTLRAAVESYRADSGVNRIPLNEGELVPGFLESESSLYDYVNNGDGTYDVTPDPGGDC